MHENTAYLMIGGASLGIIAMILFMFRRRIHVGFIFVLMLVSAALSIAGGLVEEVYFVIYNDELFETNDTKQEISQIMHFMTTGPFKMVVSLLLMGNLLGIHITPATFERFLKIALMINELILCAAGILGVISGINEKNQRTLVVSFGLSAVSYFISSIPSALYSRHVLSRTLCGVLTSASIGCICWTVSDVILNFNGTEFLNEIPGYKYWIIHTVVLVLGLTGTRLAFLYYQIFLHGETDIDLILPTTMTLSSSRSKKNKVFANSDDASVSHYPL